MEYGQSLADHIFYLAQMTQGTHHLGDPRNPPPQGHPGFHPSPGLPPPPLPPGHIQYNPPTRTGPMRLDLPPPPVFTTQPSPDVDYPNQYGPPAGFTYHAGPSSTSPLHPPPPGQTGSSSQLYAAPHSHDDQHVGKPYPGSLPTSPYGDPNLSTFQHQQMGYTAYQQPPQQLPQHVQPQLSPYYTPCGQPIVTASSNGSGGSGNMNEYFPPYTQETPGQQQQHQQQTGLHPRAPQISPPLTSPSWQSPNLVTPSTSARPEPQSATGSSQSGQSGNHGPKTSRQQFTACGACRHRRVKCDLKDRQEEFEKNASQQDEGGVGPVRSAARKQKVKCTNCQERGMNCVDEFAPMKAAKQLRRGKRISEIESMYGKQAVSTSALASSTADGRNHVATTKTTPGILPELTASFFESGFFRSFQVQRPVLDPTDFVARYLSFAEPRAANLGPEGAILCHVLYAWALSYGVNEHGQMDVPEGGWTSQSPISLLEPGKDEIKREDDRQRRFAQMRVAVEVILEEMDTCGILRKPTWDGVRALLLFLPLTEGISSPVERLSMYESALSQVFMLCSYHAMGYDGNAARTSSVNGGSDGGEGRDLHIVRIRTYWYAFVHEGITAGLKGNRLLLDGEDLDTIQDSISNHTLVTSSANFRSASRMAVAPINLALACRLINRALTGASARRRDTVNAEHVKEAWEALEGCWEEFESIRSIAPSQYSSEDDIIRFVDGWKIFLFEAQNVIRQRLEERLLKLESAQQTAYISDPSNPMVPPSDIDNVRHLLEISRSKCEFKTRQIMAIVRQHVGTRFFEWDASLVRDGTYYAAMLVAKTHGSDDDVAICVQALNELRWAHAKAWSRSADLRREWASRSNHSSAEQIVTGWEAPPTLSMINTAGTMKTTTPLSHPNSHGTNSSLSNSPYTSPSLISPVYDTSKLSLNGPPSTDGYWPSTAPIPQPHPAAGGAGNMLAPPPLQPHPLPSGAMPQHLSPNAYAMMNLNVQQGDPTMTADPYAGQPVQTVGTVNMVQYDQMQEVGYMPETGGQAGRYVFQPDGSQIYIPYSHGQ